MVTIASFRKALGEPQAHFSSLRRVEWLDVHISRSTLFAESRVLIDGRLANLYMPLERVSLKRMERLLNLKLDLYHSIIPQMEILREEMLYTDALEQEHRSDILVEYLPEGESFADTLSTASSDPLLAQEIFGHMKQLQQALHEANISHNNMRLENIIVDEQGLLRPIRWYYATAEEGGDEEFFEQLGEQLREYSSSLETDDCQIPYAYQSPFTDHIKVGNMHEGMVAVMDNEGWGFVDSKNRVIIEPQYLWVGNFVEGRVEVESEQGMGLLDKSGREIIPTIYRSVVYDPISGCSLVFNGEGWAKFDYMGSQVEPFDSALTIYHQSQRGRGRREGTPHTIIRVK